MSTAPDVEGEQPMWLLALEAAAIIAGTTAAAIWLTFDRHVIGWLVARHHQ